MRLFVKEDVCRSGANGPFVHIDKDEGRQVPHDSQSHTQRNRAGSRRMKQEATLSSSPKWRNSMLRRSFKRHKATGPEMMGQWSVHEKVAYVQTAHPRRNVAQQRVLRERNHNSPDLTDLSIDWTGYQEDQARHNAWELHTELNKITGSYADVHETNFFKGCSPLQKTHPRPNRSQSRRTGCIFVDSGVSPCTCWEKVPSLRRKRRPYDRPKILLEIQPFHNGREGLHPGSRHLLVLEVGGRFAFDIV